MRGKTVECLKLAVEACGYNFEEAMDKSSKKRIFSDIRAVVWGIYQKELHRTTGQVGRAFKRDPATIYSALIKNDALLSTSKEYRNLYDSVYGHYMNLKSIRNNR